MSATPITPADETAVPRVRTLPLIDPMLLLAAIGLMVCSLETLKGATSHAVAGHPLFYVQRQALFGGIGLLIALLLSRIDYSRLREFKYALFGLMVALNLVVYAMPPIQHARRWIPLPLLQFQSSEFGKVLLIVALAGFAVDRTRRIHQWRTTVRIMLLAVLAALVVIPQPDLGTGMVYVAVGFSLLFFAGSSFKQLTTVVAMFVASVAIVLAGAPAVGVHVLKPYQIQRLTAFLHPTGCPKSTPGVPDPCYQLQQSQIAIGSGQKTGRGNNATQTKLNFLPANDTDFVFAAV
ncbi:MAG: FtsW/RodA/SpoVE family cell cycle protein, partial [Solirubrobacteraceae bacterium]